MDNTMKTPLLDMIDHPAQLRKLDTRDMQALADEMRHMIKTTVSANGGHLASNLGLSRCIAYSISTRTGWCWMWDISAMAINS
jgi:deoxyxylulose-5-phosphate synthase